MCGRLPVGKDFLHVLQHWSVQPCVRPFDAVHMTADHNALRGSGPDQTPAFDNASTLVGCPDRLPPDIGAGEGRRQMAGGPASRLARAEVKPQPAEFTNASEHDLDSESRLSERRMRPVFDLDPMPEPAAAI